MLTIFCVPLIEMILYIVQIYMQDRVYHNALPAVLQLLSQMNMNEYIKGQPMKHKTLNLEIFLHTLLKFQKNW